MSPSRGPSPSSSLRTPSSSGEMNYLLQRLPRDSSPRTSHFNRRVVITNDCSILKRDAVFITNATCLLVALSTRRRPAELQLAALLIDHRTPGAWRPDTLYRESITLNS